MEKEYRKNEILKFLYGELNPEEERKFIDALYADESLFEEFESLKSTQAFLEIQNLEPSAESLDKIMKVVSAPVTASQRWSARKAKFSLRPLVSVYAGAAMVFAALFTIGFSVLTFQKTASPQHHEASDNMDWDASHIRERLEFVRMNLDNMSGKREVPSQLHNNTYRVVNTADFNPGSNPDVVLVNLK